MNEVASILGVGGGEEVVEENDAEEGMFDNKDRVKNSIAAMKGRDILAFYNRNFCLSILGLSPRLLIPLYLAKVYEVYILTVHILVYFYTF